MHLSRLRFVGILVVALMACGALVGCESVHIPERPWEGGWREAKILAIDGQPDFSLHTSVDCRQIDAIRDATLHFALVDHRQGRHRAVWIVLLDPHQTFQVGDRVYANVEDCSRPAEHFHPRLESSDR